MLVSGTTIGGYRIDSFLAQGGMGVVYRATQTALDRRVALKVIAPELARDPHFRERFKRESRLAAQIEHPNVIPVYEAGESDGQLFIAMRFIEGTDLYTEINRQGGLEPRRAAQVVAQVGEALDAAHRRGLIHRDVKPANVLLADGHAYLTDFGLVKDIAGADGQVTTTGQWVGTPDYVAPEQFKGEPVDARADVYALGCVLFHTLTGRVPFPRDQAVAKMWAHSEEDPPKASDFAPNVPEQVDAVIARAMAKKPADRYQSAGDLGRAAVAAATGHEAPTEERTVARGEAAPDSISKAPSTNGTRGADDAPTQAKQPSVTRESGAGSKRIAILGGAAAAVAAVIVVIVLLAGGGDGGDKTGTEPAAIAGDPTDDTPKAPEIATKIPVGGQLRDITAGGGDAWAIGRGGTVVKIDAKSGKQVGEYRPNPSGSAIEYGMGFVWATGRPQGAKETSELMKIDPVNGDVVDKTITPSRPLGIAFSEDAVYVTLATDGLVRSFNPKDLSEVGTSFVTKGPFGIEVADGRVWVTRFGGATRKEQGGGLVYGFLPPDELAVGADITFPKEGLDVGEKPWAVTYAGGSIWTASPYQTVTRIDPQRNDTLTVHPDEIFSISDIVGDENRVYIGGWKILGNKTTHQFVQRLDPETGKPIGKAVDLGETAEEEFGSVTLALGDGFLWAAADGDVFKLKL